MAMSIAGIDELFDALSSTRRRAVVAYLDDHRAGVDLRQLADAIGRYEAGRDATEDELDDRQQAVYVALYQTHLKKLEDDGVVEHLKRGSGQGGHFVRPGPQFNRAVRTLKAAEPGAREIEGAAEEEPWRGWLRELL